jgi:hypothetical protein
MKAIGFRADPRTVFWAVVAKGDDGNNVLEDSGKLIAASASNESETLGWFRTEVRGLLDKFQPDRVAVRYPEPSAQRSHAISANERVRIEGVILEAAFSKGKSVLTGALATITANLGTESAKAYLKNPTIRGMDVSAIKDYRKEAILVALAALGGN